MLGRWTVTGSCVNVRLVFCNPIRRLHISFLSFFLCIRLRCNELCRSVVNIFFKSVLNAITEYFNDQWHIDICVILQKSVYHFVTWWKQCCDVLTYCMRSSGTEGCFLTGRNRTVIGFDIQIIQLQNWLISGHILVSMLRVEWQRYIYIYSFESYYWIFTIPLQSIVHIYIYIYGQSFLSL